MGTTDSLTVMKALTQKMGWLEENQKLLAENIANSDTKGFQPKELKEIDFKTMLATTTSSIPMAKTGEAITPASSAMVGTNPMHMNTSGNLVGSPGHKDSDQKKTYETAPAKNAVILEEQLLKMNENYSDHRLITNLYQKNIDMIKLSTKTQ